MLRSVVVHMLMANLHTTKDNVREFEHVVEQVQIAGHDDESEGHGEEKPCGARILPLHHVSNILARANGAICLRSTACRTWSDSLKQVSEATLKGS